MGRFEINSHKPSTFEVAVNRVDRQTLAYEKLFKERTIHNLQREARDPVTQ
jgi:hypothetical protein